MITLRKDPFYGDFVILILKYKEGHWHWPKFSLITYPVRSGYICSLYFWCGHSFYDFKLCQGVV